MKIKQIYKLYTTVPLLFSFLLLYRFMIFFLYFVKFKGGVPNPQYPAVGGAMQKKVMVLSYCKF